MKLRSIIAVALLLLMALAAGVNACLGSAEPAQVELTLASEEVLPDFVREMPPQVQEAYRFAIANPEVLEKIPCYCGCGGMGHGNNLDCYVAAYAPDGQVAEFDNHAAYWGICVDITRDVMRLLREGKDLKTIRTYIDTEYSQYGPATDTEPVQEADSFTCSEPAADVCEDAAAGEGGADALNSLPQVAGPEGPDKPSTGTE